MPELQDPAGELADRLAAKRRELDRGFSGHAQLTDAEEAQIRRDWERTVIREWMQECGYVRAVSDR